MFYIYKGVLIIGLITKELEVELRSNTIIYYENLGYEIPRRIDSRGRSSVMNGTKILVKVEHLKRGSNERVIVECDGCGIVISEKYNGIPYHKYLKALKEGDKYYCNKCMHERYVGDSIINTLLKNSISFAQWGINNICEDFLEKYWDYDRNDINPSNILYKSNKKVWIKCQEKEYHGSYRISCPHFILWNRCPLCSTRHGKVHKLDSLGTSFPKSLEVWSDKNEKSPYEFSPMSSREIWWKCPNGIHNDFRREIKISNICNFRCPQCQHSKGEERISSWLLENNIKYEPQKSFVDLKGIGGGLLSYDFYLQYYNLLIEYQGEFHDGSSGEYSRINLKTQQEHDNRKKQYAKDNNINLLEIWYYDFENVEKILQNILI